MAPHLVDFTAPRSAKDLAIILGANESLLEKLVDPARKEAYYVEHRIPKRRPNGTNTHRRVWECDSDEVATIHKTLARRLQEFIPTQVSFPGSIAHGYVPGRSTYTNAEQHTAARHLVRVDLADFFETIKVNRVEALLGELGMHPEAAAALAQLVTIGGYLPLGLHASPLLANLAALELDHDLLALAEKSGTKVTRYADDIAFSGDTGTPSLDEICTVVETHGFSVARAKCRTTVRGQSHYVTGLSISDAVPRLPRAMKRRLRQELYCAAKYGLKEHAGRRGYTSTQAGVNRIDGMLRYFNAIEPFLAEAMRGVWSGILRKEGLGPSYIPRRRSPRAPVSIFVDETEIPTPDGPVLAISMALMVETATTQLELERLIREHVLDPFSTGDKAVIEAKGLHYVDLSEDLRTSVFKSLSSLPVRGYIAYDLLVSPDQYSATYLRLVKSLLRHRLMFCDGAEVELVFEGNSKLSLKALKDLATAVFCELENADNHRPTSNPSVRFGTKVGDPCVAIPDFFLAAFRQYAVLDKPDAGSSGKKKQHPGELAKKRFERIRDRIRLIRAVPIGRNFGRKDPFAPWSRGQPTRNP